MYFCFTQKHCLFIYMYCFLWPQVKTYLFQENKLVLKVMISLLGVKMITCLYKQRFMIYKCHYLLISQSKKKKKRCWRGEGRTALSGTLRVCAPCPASPVSSREKTWREGHLHIWGAWIRLLQELETWEVWSAFRHPGVSRRRFCSCAPGGREPVGPMVQS